MAKTRMSYSGFLRHLRSLQTHEGQKAEIYFSEGRRGQAIRELEGLAAGYRSVGGARNLARAKKVEKLIGYARLVRHPQYAHDDRS